jgi:hypothetical protein
MAVSLTNSNDLVVNSLSINDGNKIVNIKDRFMNWLSGDSTGKNVISTGEGIFTIAMPAGSGAALVVNGPNITGKVGHATFYSKVSMLEDLQVSWAITRGGLNVITTETGYTKTEINDRFSALNSSVGDIGVVGIPFASQIISKADKEAVYDKTEIDTLLAELSLSATDSIDAKASSTYVDEELAKKANDETTYSKTQIDSFFIRNDPYLVQAPLQKVFVADPSRETGNKVELRVDFSDLTVPITIRSLDGEIRQVFREFESTIYGGLTVGDSLMVTNHIYADSGSLVLTELTAYNKTEINAQRAGILTPSKIEITSNATSQIQINSPADTTDPSEIGFYRQSKNQFLKTAMGVSGGTARGAFWWAGGADRININCETGIVRIKDAIESPTIHMNVIRGLTASEITIQENVVINGNLTVNGGTSSDWNQFWVVGKAHGNTLGTMASKGRYSFTWTRNAQYNVGVYYIEFDTPYAHADDIINATNEQTGHCKVWDAAKPTANGFHVVTSNINNSSSNGVFHFSVIA